jgi:enamine deaminase RidA (YjgF/YER057c/UK114 family)
MSQNTARLSWVLASTLLVVVRASAQQTGTTQGETRKMSTSSSVQLLIPATMPKSVGYSQIATVSGGTIVFIAGQVAMDESGNVVGRDDFRAQAAQVFSNLSAAMEAVGGSFSDVVKLNYYLIDLSHLPELRDVRDKYINVSNPPTSTAVQVTRLFRPEFLVEVEAVAVLKGK